MGHHLWVIQFSFRACVLNKYVLYNQYVSTSALLLPIAALTYSCNTTKSHTYISICAGAIVSQKIKNIIQES